MSEVRKIQIQDGKGNIYHPQTVSEQVLGLDKRLEGLAKETYVDEKIAAIPEVDLSDIENNILTLEENKADKTELDNKADKTDVDSKLSLKADITYVDEKISQIPEVDLTPINNDISRLETNKADKIELESTDNKVAELEDEVSRVESTVPKMINWDNVQKISIKKEFTVEGKGRLVKVSLNEPSAGDRNSLEVQKIDDYSVPYGERFIAGNSSYVTALEWNKSVLFTCSDPPSDSAIWVEML